MAVCQFGHFPAPRGPHQVTFLDEERLIDFFDSSRFFPNGRGDRIDPDGTALEFLNDGGEDAVIHLIQAVQVYIQGLQGKLGDFDGDRPVAFNLCEIPDPSQQQVGDTWRTAAAAARAGFRACR